MLRLIRYVVSKPSSKHSCLSSKFLVQALLCVKFVRNVMAHAQKPDFVFPRNGRVHLNRWGCQFSRLLAVEMCASAWVMLDRPRSEVAWEYWLPTPFASFLFTSPPERHRVPPGSERALHPSTLYISRNIPKYVYFPRRSRFLSMQVSFYTAR